MRVRDLLTNTSIIHERISLFTVIESNVNSCFVYDKQINYSFIIKNLKADQVAVLLNQLLIEQKYSELIRRLDEEKVYMINNIVIYR